VLALSSFMGWYSAHAAGVTVSVIGWHTGTIGKLVFFVGLALIAFQFLRATGVEPPPAVRTGLVIVGVGVLASILVLIRLIDIPDRFVGSGRGIGIWISLIAALAVVVAGLLKTNEDLAPPA
jgi:hypothetical protein